MFTSRCNDFSGVSKKRRNLNLSTILRPSLLHPTTAVRKHKKKGDYLFPANAMLSYVNFHSGFE